MPARKSRTAFGYLKPGKSPIERATAEGLVGDMNLLRLKATARFLARGLEPDVYWWDLLQEAFARFLNGTRHRPPDVQIDVFMTGVMRSIRTEYLRQKSLRALSELAADIQLVDPAPDPERALLAQQELESIMALFADDPVATLIINGLADGLAAGEIRTKFGLTTAEYDSARKRMLRALLREGLRSHVK